MAKTTFQVVVVVLVLGHQVIVLGLVGVVHSVTFGDSSHFLSCLLGLDGQNNFSSCSNSITGTSSNSTRSTRSGTVCNIR